MSSVSLQSSQNAVGVTIGRTPDVLSGIKDAWCAGAIWQREPMPGFQEWIDALHPNMLPSTRVVLRPEAVADALEHLCDIAGMAYGAERVWLEADIADLAKRFATLMDAPYLRVRLDVVTTNACRKFHIDAIRARLICTYRGSGTQYGNRVDDADPADVFQVASGVPMVLRGTLWPESPSSGLVHRSPPIEGTGETRLLLVLDPVFELEDEM